MNEPDERFLVGVDGLIWQRAVRKKRCKLAASWFDSKIPFDVPDFGEFGHKGFVILEENIAINEEKLEWWSWGILVLIPKIWVPQFGLVLF